MPYSQENSEKDDLSPELNERLADYEKAELDPIRDSLKRTHTERFKTMMSLIKIGLMLKNAKVTHQPEIIPK